MIPAVSHCQSGSVNETSDDLCSVFCLLINKYLTSLFLHLSFYRNFSQDHINISLFLNTSLWMKPPVSPLDPEAGQDRIDGIEHLIDLSFLFHSWNLTQHFKIKITFQTISQ